jgi:hypothetical protein
MTAVGIVVIVTEVVAIVEHPFSSSTATCSFLKPQWSHRRSKGFAYWK